MKYKIASIILTNNNGWAGDLSKTISNPLILILLQILIILVIAKGSGFLLKKLNQPQVVGEIAAGILLGPSFIGHWFPEFTQFVFPQKSIQNLESLSHIGLILFMFIVGLELDFSLLKNERKSVAIISTSSIVIPFLLGIMIAYKLYHTFPPKNPDYVSFALFIGISMSITAFPVLARIIFEHKMQDSKIGALALSCAAANDCAAWFLLASILAFINTSSSSSALLRLLFIAIYLVLMIFIIKPFISRFYLIWKKKLTQTGIISKALMFVLFSSILTAVIGIHELFGAFLAGAILSDKHLIKEELIQKIQDISIHFLLPLFFAVTGLRTQIRLLNDGHLWFIFLLVLILAVAGKFFSSAIAARKMGQSWHHASVIGILMNTRGLIELVILNIGYDLGFLTPALFTIFVLMAVVTTFMTGPLLTIMQKVKPN